MRYIVGILLIIVFILTTTLFADTVVMNTGKKIKGLVVDEYSDRIRLSTSDGEENILRQDIERIEYDAPEQNFMQLGRSYDEKGWYDKAAFYYKKAMEVNPNYKEAREAYLASHSKMWRQEEKMTKKELERQNMAMDWWKNRNKESVSQARDKQLLLKKILGLSLLEKNGVFTIDEVEPYSSAAKTGLKKGDLLVGIWGKLIRYNGMKEVLDELLGPKYSEVRVLIEKDISLELEGNVSQLYKDLEISLSFEYEGLVVKDVTAEGKGASAGFKKGDYVTAIDKNITRYLPLDSIIALINSAKNNKNIVFTVRRNVNLRRGAK
ncbi:MAG: hypothetical protein P9L93_07505 [Candidatus Gorgyraea atricola]|nr:hypothetical protein [Candidatus Gorgyraea atricola]